MRFQLISTAILVAIFPTIGTEDLYLTSRHFRSGRAIRSISEYQCRDPAGVLSSRSSAYTVESNDGKDYKGPHNLDCSYLKKTDDECALELICDEIGLKKAGCPLHTLVMSKEHGRPAKLCMSPNPTAVTGDLAAFSGTQLRIVKTGNAPTQVRYNCWVSCVGDQVHVRTKKIMSAGTEEGRREGSPASSPADGPNSEPYAPSSVESQEDDISTTAAPSSSREYIPTTFFGSKAFPDNGVHVKMEKILPDPENQVCNTEFFGEHAAIPQTEFPNEAAYERACNPLGIKGNDSCQPTTLPPKLRPDIEFQNRKLISLFVKRAMEPTCVPVHNPHLGFKLYDIMVAIFMKTCPQIRKRFLDNARFLFKALHYVSSPHRTELMLEEDFDRIHVILDMCEREVHVHKAFLDDCMERTLAADTPTNFVCTKVKDNFNIERNDPLIDIFWKVYENAHARCFEYFKGERRMFHHFSMAALDLLSTPLKERWGTASGSHEFWQQILGPSYQIDLENIEKCTQHSVEASPLPWRLDRQTLPQNVRMTGAVPDTYY